MGDGRVWGEGERDAFGEGEAGEVDGLGADVEEFDEFEVVAVGGDGEFGGSGGFGGVVVDARDDEIGGRGWDGVDLIEGGVEARPIVVEEGAGADGARGIEGEERACGLDGGVEGEVEAEVIVGGCDLVDFDGDDVRAGDEEGGWGVGFEVDGGFLGACDGGGGGGGPCDWVGGVEIGAHDFPAV